MIVNNRLKYLELLQKSQRQVRYLGLKLWDQELVPEHKHKIEDYWASKITFNSYNKDAGNKYYVLSMFPYPSGNLHMGHVRVYTISDTIARFQRMNKKNVIHPIGWDAFGLPAENAAIERKVPPGEWTKTNIAHMKTQLKSLRCTFEWERELSTCDSRYYKWTQELFLKLLENGLAYQKEAFVNWDPVDNTVLADEQVDENMCSWRSGAKVERKLLKQWFVRTTRFAKDLYDGLDDPILEHWRDITKIQRNWIGECNGVSFQFVLDSGDLLQFWTANPEYVDQAKFISVRPSNPLAKFDGMLLEDGVKLLNVKAKNFLNGELLPVYVSGDVVSESCDTHVGIPVVSEQDKKFCDKYSIGYESDVTLIGEQIREKQLEVCAKARSLGLGGYWTSAKLRDWLISRQRYWGTPIPIIHCSKCGVVPVPKADLPVKLPEIKSGTLSETEDWVNASCPKCKGPGKRETDTMDTFVDSSWYYLRYLDVNENRVMFDVDKAKAMTPVDLYIGGKEHATLHLYYARFISHFLYSLGLLPEREPFKRLLVQGMVMGRSFRVKGTGQYVPEHKADVIDAKRNKAVHKETGQPLVMSWEKMSKSKLNGIDPNEMLKEYGIDTTRLLVLADVAPTSHRNWNSATFPGILNWQKRLWLTVQEFIKFRESPPMLNRDGSFQKHEDYVFDSRNFYLKGANFNYSVAYQFNVAISKMQGLTNSLRKVPPSVFAHSLQFERTLGALLIVLTPIAPHFACELWSGFSAAPNRLGDEFDWDRLVFEQKWPEVDNDYQLDLVYQVNGTELGVVKIPRSKLERMTEEDVLKVALQQKEVKKSLQTKEMVDYTYNFYTGYEGVVNIVSGKKVAQNVVEN
ncbi:hypothetical protein RN001_015247 [Aquatica leii]|uniref:leucine--tRNA ligase n=1 Tax=Aquatica leii TaxID=1421715 RepID=A0AAN7P1J4_9COLE|nr:hypothetical protein RN001_015247 [Aquatica leii]